MKLNLPTKIKSKEDIKKLSYDLIYKYKINYHCDESFSNIVNYKTNKKTFTKKQSKRLDDLMAQCLKLNHNYTFKIAIKYLKEYSLH